MVIEPEKLPYDIYQFGLVDENNANFSEQGTSYIRGSCVDFQQRRNVSKVAKSMVKVEEVTDKFGQRKLVLVASQSARERAILGENYDPLHAMMMPAMSWCILERIGRMRYLGEISIGKGSLQCVIKESPKSIFYHMKLINKHGWIRKQIYFQRCGAQNVQVGQNFLISTQVCYLDE